MANKIQQGHVNYLNQGLKATSLKNAFKDAVADGIESINITNLDTSEATNFNSMFSGCTVPVTINPIDMYNATDCDYMFSKTQVRNIHLKNVPKNLISNIGGTENTEYIIDSYKYNYDGIYGPIPDTDNSISLTYYARKYIPDYDTITEIPEENLKYLQSGLKANDMEHMFYMCENLTTIPNLNINTSNVTDMTQTFFACEALTSLDLSNFDTSNVTSMNSMFFSCEALTNLDLSNFDTSNVTNMTSMFGFCKALTNVIGTLDLSSCTDTTAMFALCNSNAHIHFKNVPRSLDFSNSSGTEGRHYIIDNYID